MLVTAGFCIRRTAEHGPPLKIEASEMCMCHTAGQFSETTLHDVLGKCQAGALQLSRVQYAAITNALTER
jgi:hypothetical protein